MSETSRLLEDLNKRSKEVFQRVVESYLDNGEPIGSRTLSRSLSEKVRAATVRHVMQDLEHYGLLTENQTVIYVWIVGEFITIPP